jgi:hypothetical protein
MHRLVCLQFRAASGMYRSSKGYLISSKCLFASQGSCLDALLSLPPLLVPLGINHAREGVLPPPRNAVCRSDDACQQDACRLSVPKRGCQEAHGATMVHGCLADVERKGGDWRVHEDAKVVAEIGPRDAERPHRGQDEGVAH